MRRVETADGGWVDVREKADLTVRHSNMLRSGFMVSRRAMEKIPAGADRDTDMSTLGLTFDEAQSLAFANSVGVVALVAAWSYPLPLPRSPEDVENLPADVGLAVQDAMAEIGGNVLAELLMPPNFAPSPDQSSPTGPSGASNGSARAAKSTSARSPKRSSTSKRSTSSARSSR